MYLLKIPKDHPQNYIGEYDEETSPDRFLFRSGTALPSNVDTPRVCFSVPRNTLRRYGVLPNSSMVPLVSKSVKQILTRICAKDFQAIPASVEASDGAIDGFCFLNITSKVAAFDYTQSDFLFIPGTEQIMKVNRFHIKPGAMAGHHLAREIDYMSYIWASEEVKNAFENAGVQGCEFLSPTDVHP